MKKAGFSKIVLSLLLTLSLNSCDKTTTSNNTINNTNNTVTLKGVISTEDSKVDKSKAKVKAFSGLDTKEVPVDSNGNYSIDVKSGAQYSIEASVPDNNGGSLKAAVKKDIPVSSSGQIDIGSLVTKMTGSIQGLLELNNPNSGETTEGADVFIAGTTYVGKASKEGRFTLTELPEGTWDIVIQKYGYKTKTLSNQNIVKGKPTIIKEKLMLEKETPQASGIKGSVLDKNSGKPLLGTTVTAYPTDRNQLSGSGSMNNFVSVTDGNGKFEILNMPKGSYNVQIYRPFYDVPENLSVSIDNTVQDLGSKNLNPQESQTSTVTGKLIDDNKNPLPAANITINNQLIQSNSSGEFSFDNIPSGEYQINISSDKYCPMLIPVTVIKGELKMSNINLQPNNSCSADNFVKPAGNFVVKPVRVIVPQKSYNIARPEEIKGAQVEFTDGSVTSNVIYTSSDSTVLTINDKGLMNPVGKKGVSIVTVSSTADPNIKEKITVTTGGGCVPVTLLIEDPDPVKIKAGNTKQLTAKVKDDCGSFDDSIEWKSSDQSIATVNRVTGLVIATGKGEVDITASAVLNTAIKAKIKVIVE